MNKRHFLFTLIFLLAAAPIYAGTIYYVDAAIGSDTNGGLSPSSPWKTIGKVNKSNFVPGDSILFKRGGTWWETLIPPSSGMSGNNITFGAYGTGDLPKIDGSARSYCVEGKKDYITITDLHLTSPTQFGIAHTKWNSAGTEQSTPGWIIKNCRFTKCGAYLFGPNTVVQDNVLVGPGPITGSDSHGAIVIRGLVATNCRVQRNTISGFASRGIWFLNGAGSPTANDNLVYDITYRPGTVTEGYGIDFDGYGRPITGTVTAAGNTVYDCARNGIELENCSDASTIIRNLIHDCPTGIFYLNYGAGNDYSDQRGKDVDGVVAYNVIYHCQSGISLYDVSGVDVWNNTIYDGKGSYPRGLTINDAGTAGAPFVTKIDFRNNIVGSGMSRSASAKYALNSHFIAFDYSAVVDPVIEIRSQSSYLNLSQLKSGGAALHCFTTNPGFVDAAGHDFHLLSTSPCINAGAYVGLTQDLEGKSINGVPDIGAYESGLPTSTTPPMVTTTVPSIIQSTSATSGGIVTSDGGATVTERGVCWGLSINPTVSGSHTHDGSGTGIYSSSLSGLSPNTIYHTRAYATNSKGTGYGSDISFTTVQEMTPPSVTTSPVTSITSTSASGGGIVTSGGGATVTERGLCWGVTVNPSVSGSHTHDGTGTGSYSSSLSGLSPNTVYHVRAYATNTMGTAYGSDIAFTTSQGITLPSVTTSPVTSITSTSASGGGIVTSGGGATVTERGLCWGLTANPAISGSHTHDGSGTGSYSGSLSGLSPNTTYHVRAYATNTMGTAYGSDIAFTTSQGITLPSVTTSPVTSITSTSASGGGIVISGGGATVTERGVCWGLTANPAISGSHTHDGSGTGSYSGSLSGLSPNTTYHVRAYATNTMGTAYGSDIAFTTSQGITLPSVTTSPVTSITSTSASGGGIVISGGGATVTERGVCWGSTANPTISGSHTRDGTGTGSYSSSLSGLSPNTAYHVRAYAANTSGTAYGADIPFTTTALEVRTIPFSESFAGPSLPAGWTTRNEGVGIVDKWAVSGTSLAGGNANEASYTWQDVSPGTSRLITPPIDTTGYSALYISFKHVLTTFESGGVSIKVQSSPNGSTWTDESWSVVLSDSDAGPEVVAAMLTQNLNRATTFVSFLITGNLHYFDKWYIDDVGITATPPWTLKPPAPSSPRNGSTNQPTIINLKWRDTNSRTQESGYRVRIMPAGGEYGYYDVGQNVNSVEISGLATSTRYYWNVIAVGDNVGTGDSPWANSGKDRQFTTGTITTLSKPVLVGATSASLDQPRSIVLHWQDTNSDPQEIKYDIRIKQAGGRYARYSASVDSVDHLIANLRKNTKYQWNVRAKGDRKTTGHSGWGNAGSDITFQTGE